GPPGHRPTLFQVSAAVGLSPGPECLLCSGYVLAISAVSRVLKWKPERTNESVIPARLARSGVSSVCVSGRRLIHRHPQTCGARELLAPTGIQRPCEPAPQRCVGRAEWFKRRIARRLRMNSAQQRAVELTALLRSSDDPLWR